jgi:hypothetical protein
MYITTRRNVVRGDRVGSSMLILGALSLMGLPIQALDSAIVDLDSYYHAPVVLGVSYLPVSGLIDRELADFEVFELSGDVSLSPKVLPTFQPFLTGGVLSYTFLGDTDTTWQDWSHTHVFAGAGFALSSRISREFEIGARLFGVASQSFFPSLPMEGVTSSLGQLNVLGACRT